MSEPSDAITGLRARLTTLLRQGVSDERAFGATLAEDERERTGTEDAWAPKEIIAHIAYWRERETERAEALIGGDAPPSFDDFQRLNEESFADLAAHSWDGAIARSARSVENLITAIARLPDSALAGAARESDQFGAPRLLSTIVGNGYQHPEQHLAEIAIAQRNPAGAAHIQRRMLDAVVALDAGAEVTANARYNLACMLAAAGPRDDVIGLLRQAFADNPRLIAWSRQDTDLDPLRDDPEYQAMAAEGHS